jgi:hypothetical protein
MAAMDEAEIRAALAELRRKLAKREDQPGFAANAAALKARIAQLEAMLAET